jgi:hypothetical protein
MPPMEVKKETTKETTSGINGETSTPETGKCIRTPQSGSWKMNFNCESS